MVTKVNDPKVVLALMHRSQKTSLYQLATVLFVSFALASVC